MQQGFTREQLVEFGHLTKMALSRYIPKSMLQGWVPIDNGSFGKIYRCTYDGRDMAVKEIGQSKDGQSAIKTKMRDLVLELRILVQIRHPPNACAPCRARTATDPARSRADTPTSWSLSAPPSISLPPPPGRPPSASSLPCEKRSQDEAPIRIRHSTEHSDFRKCFHRERKSAVDDSDARAVRPHLDPPPPPGATTAACTAPSSAPTATPPPPPAGRARPPPPAG